MSRILHVKYLLIFIAAWAYALFSAPEALAQTIDSTSASTSHLRMAANTLDDRLTVQVVPVNKSMKYVKIFDIIGNEVASIDLAGKSSSMTFSLDVSRLENGIYLCNLYSDKGIVETKKIYWSK